MENGLRDWAKDQKLVPWVAIAAQLPIKSMEMRGGSLFTVLPLPIVTNQPVHIHGLFSITPDRARLYQSRDRSIQDQNPGNWNDWLLQDLVPRAWTKLLSYLADSYPQQSAFERWPHSIDDHQDPLIKATERIMEIIAKESLALWPTVVGYVTTQNGLLSTGFESTALRDALQEAGAPVVYVPPWLQPRANDLFENRTLCPENLCRFVKTASDKVRSWGVETKQQILEYLLSKPGFIEYDGLELFPSKDGTYRPIGKYIAFVHRDELEEILFGLDDSHNLDLEKFSEAAKRTLKQGCEFSKIHPSIRYRSAHSLRDYCMENLFKHVVKDQDMNPLDKECVELVSKVWSWISGRGIDILNEAISCLWLLPLSNRQYRKILPESSSLQVYLAPRGEIGDLVWKFHSKSSESPLLLLDKGQEGLPSHVTSILKKSSDVMSRLSLKDADHTVVFLEWLHLTSPLLDDASDEEKQLVASLAVSGLPQKLAPSEKKTVVQALSYLKIFQKVSWHVKSDQMETILTWTNLSSYTKSIGLLDGMIPVPEIDGVQFLIAEWPSSSNQLLKKLELADCIGSVQAIEDYIVPAWRHGHSKNWTSSSKEQVSAFILGQFSLLSHDLQAKIGKTPMVPVMDLHGKESQKFELAESLIDPSVASLKQLYFEHEEVIPKESFLRDFAMALKACGLKTAVDEAVIDHRANCYANVNYSLSDIRERALKLLESHVNWSLPPEQHKTSNLRRLKWLPATDIHGILSLKTPGECRGRRDRLLASSQLSILELDVSPEWEARLGWHTILPNPILLSQLNFGVQRKDRQIIDAVLSYISENDLTELVADELMNVPCILVSSGVFVAASEAVRPPKSCFTSCDRLQPYLANVENKFWGDHEKLLIRLGIRDLHPADLLRVQAILETRQVLEESDVLVAIEILNLAIKFPRDSLVGLKVISNTGKFHLIHNINVNDLGLLRSKQKFNLTHPYIPLRTVHKLGIGSLSERLMKGMLEIEDVDDEDEFDQRENVMTRIVDTLNRYSIEATFKEYLANADDTKGASKISWLLDERYHPNKKLLTQELKNLQGPALLVHNNGVFSDDDFKGFKNVGEGSKAKDSGTIGQFGRGSQTMYHWTDVPMILSGKNLLILDPQQEVLPINQIKGKRKPGVKLELSKLREACHDQLIPFEGLWEYTRSLNHYSGTIFRFPLRTACTKSLLRINKRDLNTGEIKQLLSTYFDEARISLLFLRRVNSIDFRVYGEPKSVWTVSKDSSGDDVKSFSEKVTCQFDKATELGVRATGRDEWWVAIEDLRLLANPLPENSRRVMKNVECGIAALISSKLDNHDSNVVPPMAIQSKIFNTLPLPICSDLPVHIHATFMLSGDRQSILIDENSTEPHISKWNRLLLQQALPKLYLTFLDDIKLNAQQTVFNFWPQEQAPKRSCSELLCASFWDILPTSLHRVFPEARLANEVFLRRAVKRYDINQAVFDFLPRSHSEILAPLFMSLEINLVRNVPKEVAIHLKALPNVNQITSSMLRSIFKSEMSRNILLREMNKNPRILEALLDQIVTNTDFDDLDGCQILLLADGTLAELKVLNNQNAQPPKYYVASKEELKLFGFAAGCLVTSTTSTKVEPLLKSGNFNLTGLQLCHVRDLLKRKPPVSKPNPEENKWLAEFWEYWNKSIASSLSSLSIDDLAVEIYQATRDGINQYKSPAAFHQLAAVIEPSVGVHQQLCSKIPGLYRFNTEFMPQLLVDNESSFNKEDSFYRFISALRRLASHAGISIGTFVETHLDIANLKELRDLIVSHVSCEIQSQESENFLLFSYDLKSIPLWPSLYPSTTKQLLSANDALMLEDDRFLVSGMKDCHRFVDFQFVNDSKNQRCLLKLGVTKLPVKILLRDHVLPLPSTLSNTQWRYFKPLVAAFSEFSFADHYLFRLLTQNTIAADEHCKLREANELYDHDDQIFLSAFRQKKATKFLHDDVKMYRSFWLRVGLRHQNDGFINPSYYVQCLQELKIRLSAKKSLNDPHLAQDSLTVLSPLIAINSNIQRFSFHDWQAVSKERVFLSRTDFNPESEYRRNTMASVAAAQRILCLSEVISYRHAEVCWSQTSFAMHEPTREVLSHVRGNGKPKADMVWRHLQHLRSIAQHLKIYQIRDFLADLHLTYEYLQDNLDNSKANFNLSLKSRPVWLNLNTTHHDHVTLDDVKSSWHNIGELVLSSSCDAGSIKAVKSGLMCYEKLLRALGCSSITYPTVIRPTLHLGSSVSSSLQQLRKEDKMIDITYSTEGKLIKAHRLVLAAISEKCAAQFSGRWKMEEIISYDEHKDGDDFLSYHTLSTMIDYAYEDEIDWKEMEVLESDDADRRAVKLDLLLDLHKGADYWLIPTLKSEVEDKILVAGKAFINLENVIEIQKRADVVGAKAVEQMCIKQNKVVVKKAHSRKW